jgi:hypothetical protein
MPRMMRGGKVALRVKQPMIGCGFERAGLLYA